MTTNSSNTTASRVLGIVKQVTSNTETSLVPPKSQIRNTKPKSSAPPRKYLPSCGFGHRRKTCSFQDCMFRCTAVYSHAVENICPASSHGEAKPFASFSICSSPLSVSVSLDASRSLSRSRSRSLALALSLSLSLSLSPSLHPFVSRALRCTYNMAVRVSVYVSVRVPIHAYIYMYVCMYVFSHVRKQILLHMQAYELTGILCICKYIYCYICVDTQINIYVYVDAHVQKYLCICACMHV